jgi:protein-tyrosine-phosphatase
MAALIARGELGRTGVSGIDVASAGIAAISGATATRTAALVAEEHGLSLANHRARQLTRELLASTDLVVGMQQEHARYADSLGAAQATTLSRPVPDPFGGDVQSYRETWALLSAIIPPLLQELRLGQN